MGTSIPGGWPLIKAVGGIIRGANFILLPFEEGVDFLVVEVAPFLRLDFPLPFSTLLPFSLDNEGNSTTKLLKLVSAKQRISYEQSYTNLLGIEAWFELNEELLTMVDIFIKAAIIKMEKLRLLQSNYPLLPLDHRSISILLTQHTSIANIFQLKNMT
jgi:hypothetical protein